MSLYTAYTLTYHNVRLMLADDFFYVFVKVSVVIFFGYNRKHLSYKIHGCIFYTGEL